jgi:hypothetical protein
MSWHVNLCASLVPSPQTEAQLRKLPPPPASDPSFELFSRLRDLARAVAQAVEGSDDAAFFRAADQHYSKFRQSVLSARPTVRLTCDSDNAFIFGKRAWQEEDAQFWLQGPKHSDEDGEPEGLITLQKARQLAAQYRVRELPSFLPYRVLEELVQVRPFLLFLPSTNQINCLTIICMER